MQCCVLIETSFPDLCPLAEWPGNAAKVNPQRRHKWWVFPLSQSCPAANWPSPPWFTRVFTFWLRVAWSGYSWLSNPASFVLFAASGASHGSQEAPDHFIGVNAISLGFVGQQEPVPQHIGR